MPTLINGGGFPLEWLGRGARRKVVIDLPSASESFSVVWGAAACGGLRMPGDETCSEVAEKIIYTGR